MHPSAPTIAANEPHEHAALSDSGKPMLLDHADPGEEPEGRWRGRHVMV